MRKETCVTRDDLFEYCVEKVFLVSKTKREEKKKNCLGVYFLSNCFEDFYHINLYFRAENRKAVLVVFFNLF